MSLLLCLALTCGTLTLREIDDRLAERHSELSRTQRELEDLHRQIAGFSHAESSSLARLETLREQVELIRRYTNELTGLLETRTAEIAAATRGIEETSIRLDARRDELGERLVTLYKYGRLLPLQALLEADSPARFYRRIFYLRWLTRADRRFAEQLDALKKQLSQHRARLIAARVELEQLREERYTEEQRLEVAEQAETEILNRFRSQQEAKRQLESELAVAVDRLEELITQLDQQRLQLETPDEDHHFIQNKGSLPWPARGRIIAEYGTRVDPRYQTTTANRGIDIATQPGTSAQAIHDGQVVYADQFRGYGRMVIIDHNGGYYTLYGNLAEIGITVGSRISTGDAVGKTRDYLHFEIRRGGQPVNPVEWLMP